MEQSPAEQGFVYPLLAGSKTRQEAREPLVELRGSRLTAPEAAAVRAAAAALQPLAAHRGAYDPGEARRGAVPWGGLAYRSGVYPEGGRPLHLGQAKLGLSELRAILAAFAAGWPEDGHVIYVGAAPGCHIPWLARLFPRLTFTLVDPNVFALPEVAGVDPARFRVVRACCDDALARRLGAERPGALFFDDHRSGQAGAEDFEEEVYANMRDQERWFGLARAAFGLLKFRLPYTAGGGAPPPFAYLAGEVHLQPFAPPASSEARLFVRAGAGRQEYCPGDYEAFMFWHNAVVRTWATFDTRALGAAPGLCGCWDCAAAVKVLGFPPGAPPPPPGAAPDLARVAAGLAGLAAVTRQSLVAPPHGTPVTARPGLAPPPLAWDVREGLVRAHQAEAARRAAAKAARRAAIVPHAPPQARKGGLG